jgi:hypothetical protein
VREEMIAAGRGGGGFGWRWFVGENGGGGKQEEDEEKEEEEGRLHDGAVLCVGGVRWCWKKCVISRLKKKWRRRMKVMTLTYQDIDI